MQVTVSYDNWSYYNLSYSYFMIITMSEMLEIILYNSD